MYSHLWGGGEMWKCENVRKISFQIHVVLDAFTYAKVFCSSVITTFHLLGLNQLLHPFDLGKFHWSGLIKGDLENSYYININFVLPLTFHLSLAYVSKSQNRGQEWKLTKYIYVAVALNLHVGVVVWLGWVLRATYTSPMHMVYQNYILCTV